MTGNLRADIEALRSAVLAAQNLADTDRIDHTGHNPETCPGTGWHNCWSRDLDAALGRPMIHIASEEDYT